MRTKNRMFELLLVGAVTVGAAHWVGPASARADEPPKDAGAVPAVAPPDAAKDAEKKPPEFPPFEEVSKDHKKIPGFIELYHDEKKDHLLAVIPKSMLGKEFLIAQSIAGGPVATGFMWETQVVQWQEMDKKLVLIEPDLRYAEAKDSTVADVVARTYTQRIVLHTPIVSKRDGDPVIDMDSVFKSDRAGLEQIYEGSMNPALSRWAKIKGFEKNVELSVDAAIMSGQEGGTRARVHFSISELPNGDYKPRQADPRVGYALTARMNWGRKHDEKTVFDRYIHRWQLRKADAAEKVSDVHPDDQVVFYIEQTVPVQYRRYVREGILLWNEAFEKAGLRNVMAVRQQTDTNEFKDMDPEDVRYNFFRWIVSGRAFAMGPSRVDPRTGQILDADIVWDDSLVRSLLTQYANLAARGPAASYDPQLNEFLARRPEWNFQMQEELLTPGTVHIGGADLSRALPANDPMGQGMHTNCNMADGLRHELALAGFALQAQGMEGLTEEFIGEFIRYVTCHEVGHTLGLRHNFKASSWKPMDALLGAKDAHLPTSASVMDYNAGIYTDSKDNQPRFFTPSVGPYDLWAIEYGYRHTDEEYKEEPALLAAIASRGNQDGLAYGTDEDTGLFAPDPLVNRWDNGSDPVAYAKHRMELIQRLQSTLADWAVKDGEPYTYLRRAFDALLAEYGRSAQFAVRLVGGQYANRNHKGDADEKTPITIVPVAKQRESLEFVIEHVFSDKAFTFDAALLNKLAAGRWGHWESDDFDSQREYPIHDRIAAVQYWPLFYLMNPFTLGRVYDAEIKVPADQDAVTVPEVMTRTTAAIWSELTRDAGEGTWSTRKPFVSSVRRTLQRTHLNMLTDMVLAPPGRDMPADIHALARMTLKGLVQQIGQVLTADAGGKLDPSTRAHLDDAKTRIEKALQAEYKL
ncbi:MAG: DUF5117 domain-containing protein [Phycisphaerales bacterium]|nr:DUF5117 domain-containing protein [Phycisphaerales bacterium]